MEVPQRLSRQLASNRGCLVVDKCDVHARSRYAIEHEPRELTPRVVAMSAEAVDEDDDTVRRRTGQNVQVRTAVVEAHAFERALMYSIDHPTPRASAPIPP